MRERRLRADLGVAPPTPAPTSPAAPPFTDNLSSAAMLFWFGQRKRTSGTRQAHKQKQRLRANSDRYRKEDSLWAQRLGLATFPHTLTIPATPLFRPPRPPSALDDPVQMRSKRGYLYLQHLLTHLHLRSLDFRHVLCVYIHIPECAQICIHAIYTVQYKIVHCCSIPNHSLLRISPSPLPHSSSPPLIPSPCVPIPSASGYLENTCQG